MPSSLMARLKATQGDAPTSASRGGGRSRVVTPRPPASSLSSRSTSRPSSSLAAVAASSSASSAPNGIAGASAKSSGYVPQFKKNPLNANATVAVVSVADESSTYKAADETHANKAVTRASAKFSGSVAQFKKNPLNAAVAVVSVADADDPSTTKATDEAHDNKPPSDRIPPKTLIQQLLQRKNDSPSVPPPYYMCSESEALDRQQHLELSPLECNAGTLDSGVISTLSSSTADNTMDRQSSSPHRAARHRPKFNPQYVIKKYRRSAAGGGALSESSDRCPRTLDQLDKTVDYLLGNAFAHQMPPPTAVPDDNDHDARNTDPNEISIWEEDTTPVKQRPSQTQQYHSDARNMDPNEISLWEEDETPAKQRPKQAPQDHSPFTLSSTVSFIDDRLRAVQKDLVTLLGNTLEEPSNASSSESNSASAKRNRVKRLRTKQTVREMQAKMVRYNILTLYLLSGVSPSKYEVKFGTRALRTSLTCYLNLSTSLQEQYCNIPNGHSSQYQSQYKKECRTQDEIMAYMALLHSSAVLRSEETALPPPTSGEITSSLMEDSGSGWGALLSTFCKHVLDGKGAANESPEMCDGGMVEKYPRWKWALELACVAQEGNYQRYFNLLGTGPATSPTSVGGGEMAEAHNARFLILARCCASHSMTLMRLAQVRRYNRAFGKAENVPARDLARLLRLDGNDIGNESVKIVDGSKRAVELCLDAGLPIVEKENREKQKELYVTMKSVPINVNGEEAISRICNPGRMNDSFVFGSNLFDSGDGGDGSGAMESLANQLQQCGIQEDMDDWEMNDGYADDSNTRKLKGETTGSKSIHGGARNDEDGVVVPASDVMWNLIEL